MRDPKASDPDEEGEDPMTPEQEIVAFHYQVGVAIMEWTNVENALAGLLVAGFEDANRNREALALGLFSLEGFGARLAFVEHVVMRKVVGGPYHAEWTELVDRARTLSRSRNKIAHWGLGKYPKAAEGKRVVLQPWKIAKGQDPDLPPDKALWTREIGKVAKQFFALAVSISNFTSRLAGKPERHAKSDEQPNDQPTTQNLVRQIREVVQLPPKSLKA